MEGGTIVQLANLSTLWGEAQVYTTQLYQIPKGATATILVPGSEKEIKGRIEFSNPEVSTEKGINLIRVLVPNPGNHLRPGMSILVRVQTANRNSLALPTDAIIRDANGATVWIQVAKNKFRSQMVTPGFESNGLTEIISGLKEGDAVVIRGAYLLHSEFVFKRGADPMTSHSH
jgi:Cu(I)/Ag(I) efflux system membrane fusion protein